MGKHRLDPHTAADVADTLSSLAVGAVHPGQPPGWTGGG